MSRDGNSLGKDVGIGEVVGFFETFIAEPGADQSDYYSRRYNKIGTFTSPETSKVMAKLKKIKVIWRSGSQLNQWHGCCSGISATTQLARKGNQ